MSRAVSKKPVIPLSIRQRPKPICGRKNAPEVPKGLEKKKKTSRMLFRGHLPRRRAHTLIAVVQVGRATLAWERPAAYKLCQKRRRNINRAAEFNAR